MRRFRQLTALVVLLLLSVACGSDAELRDEVGSLRDEVSTLAERVAAVEATPPTTTPTTLPSTTTSTSLSPPPTTVPPQSDLGRLAVEFFIASESLCLTHANQTGNPPPDPERYRNVEVIEILDSDRVLIRDGLGDELVVDFGTEPVTIYSSEGADAILPRDLSFGCPPDLYPGTVDQ